MFDKETSVVALVVATILVVFVAVQPIVPTNAEHFSELGILGSQQKIANYPSTLAKGEPFLLYAYIGNHEGAMEYYEVVLKLGNVSTLISNTTAADAPIISTYTSVLGNGGNTTFPMHLSVNEPGINQRLLFELWTFDSTNSSFVYSGLWNQLWVNVTAT